MANPTLNVWRAVKAPLDVWRGQVLQTPVVLGVSPSVGSTAGGTSVTITGYGFTGAASVLFGTGSAASFVVVSDTTITAVTAATVSSTVPVSVANATYSGSLPNAFTFSNLAPTFTSLSQTMGPWSAISLVFNGTNLMGATSATLNGVSCSITGNTATTVTLTTPVFSANAGPYVVAITTPGGTATSGAVYTVRFDFYLDVTSGAPVVVCDDTTISVSSWTNRAGLGNLVQATGANQPTLTASDTHFNNKPSLLFTSTNSNNLAGVISYTGKTYLFIALRLGAFPAAYQGICSIVAPGQPNDYDNGGSFAFVTDNAVSGQLDVVTNGAVANNVAGATATTAGARVVFDGSNLSSKFNNTLGGVVADANLPGGTSAHITLGSRYIGGSPSAFADVTIAGVLLYTTALTGTDITHIKAEMNSRWGTSLT